MSRKDRRFGSSYDPFNTEGMRQRQREQEQQDQYQVRGCGDPNCMSCNPQTASRPGASPYMPSGSFLGAVDFKRLEALMAERAGYNPFGGRIIPPLDMSGADDDDEDLDDRYEEAREKVKNWLSKVTPEQTFDDIVGNEESLAQLRDAVQAPVMHKGLYEAYGMKMPKGALLSGPPGCGKTMFARAAAFEMKKLYEAEEFEFISISGSELQTGYVGETERYIREIFDFAAVYKEKHGHPLLIFMDEAEVFLPDRTGRIRRVAMWEESQVATFLAKMDGLVESGAFVLLASNRPEVIDSAVLRDGRCDFKITVSRPTHEAIEVILRKNFAPTLCADDRESLVMAAVESLFDPHKVILEDHLIKVNWKATSMDELIADKLDKHFLLEHIVSGAMAASIPARATRYAFNRDKETGVAKGVTVADVVRAVGVLFEENRNLDHSYALREFREDFMKEAVARDKK